MHGRRGICSAHTHLEKRKREEEKKVIYIEWVCIQIIYYVEKYIYIYIYMTQYYRNKALYILLYMCTIQYDTIRYDTTQYGYGYSTMIQEKVYRIVCLY